MGRRKNQGQENFRQVGREIGLKKGQKWKSGGGQGKEILCKICVFAVH